MRIQSRPVGRCLRPLLTCAALAALVACTPSDRVPGTPRELRLVERGDQFVRLAWEAPTKSGELTGYQVRTVDGQHPVQVGSSDREAWVTGLVNGTTYAFEVVAINPVGEGAASSPVSVTPATVPEAPQINNLQRGDGQLQLSWSTGGNGGAALTSLILEGAPGPIQVTLDPQATGHTLTALENGVRYELTVRAVNAMGSSPASLPVSAAPATLPGVPRELVATGADSQVTLQWQPPQSDGGEPLLGYRIQVSPGDANWEVDAQTQSFTVPGLLNGQPYAFLVFAHNRVGTSAEGAQGSATPAAPPGPPVSLSAVPRERSADLAWEAPLESGGAAILDYEVAVEGGGQAIVTTTSTTVQGLRNGFPTQLSVRARNAVGWGPPATITVRPRAEPAILSVEAPQGAVACVRIPYLASRPVEGRVDVVVEFDDGSGYRRATQAPSREVPGIHRRAATPSGAPHQFLWDAFADLGRRTAEVKVRITPTATEDSTAVGLPVESPPFQVDNLARLAAPVTVQASTSVLRLVSADFNRDGWPDLGWVAASGEVAIQLALQDGTFAAPALVTAPSTVDLVVADFDRDAREDLALLTTAGEVLLAQGVGDGSFLPGTPRPLGAGTDRLLTSDLDLDGWADLVAVASSAGTVSTLLRPAATPAPLSSALATTVHQPLLEDVDGDGRPELVFLAANSDQLGVALGVGDGTFGAPATFALPSVGSRLVLNRIPGAPRSEALVVLTAGGIVSLAPQGASSFDPPSVVWSDPVQTISVADLDLDGRPDLLLTQGSQAALVTRVPAGLAEVSRLDLGSSPDTALLMDFDRDGDPDLLGGGPAGALLSDNSSPRPCGARFAGPQLLHSAGRNLFSGAPQPVTVGDLNGDGKWDVVGIVNRYRGEFSGTGREFRVWWGLGDGSFWAAPFDRDRYAPTYGFDSVAALDLDGDGADELFAGVQPDPYTSTGGELFRLWLSPDGTLESLEGRPMPGLECLFVGRVNQDESPDLLVGHSAGRVRTLLGGGGALTEGPEAELSAGVCGGAVGDVNGDGLSDLVFAAGPLVSTASPEGLLTAPRPLLESPLDCGVPRLEDLNHDGRKDLLCHSSLGIQSALQGAEGVFGPVRQLSEGSSGHAIGVLGDAERSLLFARSTSEDRFSDLPVSGLLPAFESYPHIQESTWTRILPADFDSDGRQDLLIASNAFFDPGVARVFVWSFRDLVLPAPALFTVLEGTQSLVSGDFDADGCLDLSVAGTGGAAIARGDCQGSFSTPTSAASTELFRLAPGMSREGPGRTTAVDFDRDGSLDLLTTAVAGGELRLFKGDGSGGLEEEVILAEVGGARINVEDLNRDGRLDVVTDVSGTIRSLLGQADGSVVSTPYSSDLAAAGVAIVDLDRDGLPDLVAGGDEMYGSDPYPSLHTFRGRGDGSFEAGKTGWGTSNFVQEVAASDVNRDGFVDIVAAVHGQTGSGDRGGVEWRSVVPSPQNVPAYGSPGANALNVFDMNRDGLPDFITAGEGSSDVSIFWAYPDGTNPTSTQISVGESPRDVAVGDFNNDGRPDLAVLIGDTSSVRILLGR